MSYTPTEWKTGDVITADKLNNMESGIVNGLAPDLIIKATDTKPYPLEYNATLIKGSFSDLKEKWENDRLIYTVFICDGSNVGGGVEYVNGNIQYMSSYQSYGECFRISAVISSDQKYFIALLSDGTVVLD